MEPTQTPTEMAVLPGSVLVLFLVRMERSRSVVAVPPAGFLEGLRAAVALMSFTTLCGDDVSLEELLPWAGSV